MQKVLKRGGIMKRILISLSVLFLLNLLPIPAGAQNADLNLNMSRPLVGTAVTSKTAPIRAEGSGIAYSLKWIAASQFAVRYDSAAPQLTYSAWHFYNSPGSATPERYFAQVDVEPGVIVDEFICVFNDSSATNDIYMSFQKYTANASNGTLTGVYLGSYLTSGTPGVSYAIVDFTPETISTLDINGPTLIQYYLSMDVADDTSFAGCWISYQRQVSPAPATATFNDVPTSHPFFQYIEALYESGVTAGCGGGNYCPNSYVTRGQMAVFLSRLTGLNWPY
jgi:hypothetical protein